MELGPKKGSSKLKTKAINKKFNLPKGNWSKQLKIVPSCFKEMHITEHHCNSLAKKHLTLGYRMFKASKVSQVFLSPGSKLEVSSEQHIYIKSIVEASFTISSKYEVAIKMKKDSGRVVAAWCACKAGSCGVCKHVGSVLWFILDCTREARTFIPDDITCTEKARTWSAPNEKRKINNKTFADLDFVKHVPGKCSDGLKVRKRNQKNYSVLDEVGTLDDDNNVQNRIKQVTERLNAGKRRSFFCLLQEENNFFPVKNPSIFENRNDEAIKPRPTNEDFTIRISLPVAVLKIDTSIKDLLTRQMLNIPDNLKLTLNAAIILEVETREQSNCLLWKSERKSRITASKFGSICKRQKEVNESFLKTIFNGADLSHNKYVQEGLKNETLATQKYQNLRLGVKTFSVGLCVNPTLPMFGASPDRLVYDENTGYGLLEIKTLAKCKEKGMSINEAIAKKEATAKFLKMDENYKIFLDQKHTYYYQVQGQLGITCLKWCDFLVDIGDDNPFTQRINFDEKFFNEKIVPCLVNFYINQGLPYLGKRM